VHKFARLAFAFPAIFVFASVCIGQRTPGTTGVRFRVIGNVTNDADHTPIEGVQARLSTAQGEVIATSVSRQNGDFTFENLPGGEYTISFSANGYEPHEESFLLRVVPEAKLDVSLRKTMVAKSDGLGADNAVSTRELTLPAKAKDALAKGRERLYQKRDYAGGLAYFRRVLEISPGFYEAYYDEGVAYTFLLKPADAEDAFRKSIAGSGGHYAKPWFALASLLTDGQQFVEAEKIAREGLNIQPDAWRGYYELARALLGEKNPAEAEKNGLEARKRKTDFPGLYLILANIHIQLRNNEAVLEDVNTFLKLDPDGPASGQARKIKDQMERTLGHSPSPPALER
jgi:tetratricopeptide (TPR) repeat protein